MLLKLLAIKDSYVKNEEGATAIEYGLIAGAVAVVLVAAMAAFGPALQGLFTGLGTSLTAATP